MTAMGRRGLAIAGVIGAVLCFSLGWFASRSVDAPKREPASTPSSEPVSVDAYDSGVVDPLLLIDPSKVMLLPDASLTIEPPTPPLVPGQTNDRRD